MGAKNKVIAGDYEGKMISSSFGKTRIMIGFSNNVIIDKWNVDSYEVIDETSRKSATSGAIRGALVGSLFGGVGMIAGALSAKSKGVHTLAILFKDGKKSLIEVDDKIYKSIMTAIF